MTNRKTQKEIKAENLIYEQVKLLNDKILNKNYSIDKTRKCDLSKGCLYVLPPEKLSLQNRLSKRKKQIEIGKNSSSYKICLTG
ncbi:hypothetical protein MHBO_001749, partial [Bonamia ostreae]